MCVGMGLGGMGLWNRYPRETVNPSFEPQPPSLMLKMRFLKRSGRKYEKNCSYGHGVSWRLAKVVRWACAFTRFSRFFLQGKLRKIAKNAWKKWTKISTYFNLRDGIKPRDFCGIKNPVILWFFGIKNRGFIPYKSQNPEIFIPQKSRNPGIWDPGKIPFNFRPFPENFLFFLCQLNLHNYL